MTRHRDPAGNPLDTATHPVRGPAELVQAVPYLLGFHPSESLVLVGLDAGIVVVTARLDLDDADRPGVVAHTLSAIARGGAGDLIVVVYDDGANGPTPARRESVLALIDSAGICGLDVRDALHVAGGRWWSYRCASALCCPPEGTPTDTSVSSFAAAATYAGMVALPDREALESVLNPVAPRDRDALVPAIAAAENAAVAAVLDGRAPTHERSVKRAIFALARASDQPAWNGLDDDDVARFGAALVQIPVRDALWLAIESKRIDGRPLWRELGRRLPAPYDAAPLFLYGWTSWRHGDGASAGIAAERAIRSDPGYSAADLLLAALSQGVDPRRMPRLRLPRSTARPALPRSA